MIVLLRITGGIFAVIGALFSVLFALIFLVLFVSIGPYGLGVVLALVYVLPALLISLCLFALGRYFLGVEDKETSTNHSYECPPPYPPSHLLPARKESL